MPTPPTTPSPSLTVEAIVAVDAAARVPAPPARPRRRLHGRGGRHPAALHAVAARRLSGPADRFGEAGLRPAVVARRSPAGVRPRRRDLGRRSRRVAADPRRRQAGRRPRAALVARRPSARVPVAPPRLDARSGSIDAPVPRRGRPATEPKPPRPTVLTETGVDVDAFEWAPDGARIAVMARGGAGRRRDRPDRARRRRDRRRAGSSPASGSSTSAPAGCRDGSLLYVSDADGWFQVVRLTADGHDRIVLTAGEREHGEPGGGAGVAPLPSPDGSRFVHVEVHDGLQDLVVGELAAGRATEARPRPPAEDAADRQRGGDRGSRINPWDGVWRSVGWLGRRRLDRGRRRARDRAAGPVAAAGAGRRPRRRATAPGHRFACRPSCATRSSPARVAGRRADRHHGARRAPGRGHAVAPEQRDRQAWRQARSRP